MTFLQTVETGVRGILSHRLRSILTTLGILFGVAAVICTVGIGQASSDAVNKQIASLGTNQLTITGTSTFSNGIRGAAGSNTTLTSADVSGLEDKGNAPDIAAVAPIVSGSTTIINGSETTTTTVTGTTSGWLTANSRSLSQGTFITDADVTARARVVVLGTTTASDLGVTVGDSVVISGNDFTVVGILTSTGTTGISNNDDIAVAPISTTRELITGGTANTVSRIIVTATSNNTVGSAYQEADNLLLETHHITNATAADFTIGNPSSFLNTAQSVTSTLTILLASVAGISLLVGGIGVMNIMLVSVTERTSEIGLRKALGATPSDILRQFLVEAAVLSATGGVLGVAFALLAGVLVPHFFNIAVTITATPVIIAVAVAAGVGLIFGVYPATRAARLAPIEALRSQ